MSHDNRFLYDFPCGIESAVDIIQYVHFVLLTISLATLLVGVECERKNIYYKDYCMDKE